MQTVSELVHRFSIESFLVVLAIIVAILFFEKVFPYFKGFSLQVKDTESGPVSPVLTVAFTTVLLQEYLTQDWIGLGDLLNRFGDSYDRTLIHMALENMISSGTVEQQCCETVEEGLFYRLKK